MRTTVLAGLLAIAVMPVMPARSQAPSPEAAPPAAAAPVDLSPAVSEVVRLAEAGTSEDVLLAYIQNSGGPFNLTADQIIYLKDIGVTQGAVTAMLNRDSALRGQAQTYTYNQQAYPATVPPPAEPAPAPAPQPEPAPPTTAVVTPPLVPQTPVVYDSSPPADVTYFYNDLSPYGSWVNLDGVGWCWQPRVVVIDRGWTPYCDGGHWVYSDCGWFWASDYSWGWAPFHYGRWQHHDRCGWVWLPDRTWGPSWVVWRSEGDYCGWAPLPPHAVWEEHGGWRYNGVRVSVGFDFNLGPSRFTFVHLGDFDRHDLHGRRLQPTQVTQIYNHTTVINNYEVHNNTIINNGIPPTRVAAATHTPIRPIPVHAVTTASHEGPAHVQGGALQVYRPPLKSPPPAATAHMVAQRVDPQHPVIQHASAVTASAQRQNVPGRNYSPGNNAPGRNWAPSHSAPSATPAPRSSYTPSPTPGRGQTTAERNTPATTSRPTTTYQPNTTSRSSGNQEAVQRNYQAPAAPASRSANTYQPTRSYTPTENTRPAANYNQSYNSYNYRREQPTQYPLRTYGDQSSGSVGRGPGQYEPKGYHQATESRGYSQPEQQPQRQPQGNGYGYGNGNGNGNGNGRRNN